MHENKCFQIKYYSEVQKKKYLKSFETCSIYLLASKNGHCLIFLCVAESYKYMYLELFWSKNRKRFIRQLLSAIANTNLFTTKYLNELTTEKNSYSALFMATFKYPVMAHWNTSHSGCV